MRYCPNCGQETNPGAAVCLNCGYLLHNPYNYQNKTKGKGISTVSVVFGSLGFYPLVFVGSIIGIVTGIIGIYESDSQYVERAKIGLWLSIGSLVFWILILAIFMGYY